MKKIIMANCWHGLLILAVHLELSQNLPPFYCKIRMCVDLINVLIY